MNKTCITLFVALLFPAHGAADDWNFAGDLRASWVYSETRARDGTESDNDEFRARLRLGGTGTLSDSLTVRVRAAGVFSSNQGRFDPFLRGYTNSPTGIAFGEVTLDELYLEYAPPGADWSLKLGRFQTAFLLDGVAKKSLDRNTSPNLEVNWTDGVHFVHGGLEGWNTHVILQHNHRKGPSNTFRPPLAFADSRVSAYGALAATSHPGPFVQRELGLTWLGDALPGDEDYVALALKAAAAWPFGDTGRRLLLAGEAGHAFHTQPGASGFAWQASLNVYDIFPSHRVGVVYGRVPDGWLISSDFRPNDTLVEVRWVWQLTPAMDLAARLRTREEIRFPPGNARRTHDGYIRLTWKF